MTQLVFAAAGAAIGSFVGMPQLGWAIGSMIGGAMAMPDVQGPRLDDRKVQLSSYGAPISQVWGSVRIAGSVVWSTDLLETANGSGGKGGPTTPTYSYSVSCAVAICEGPKAGIRRIWADAKLVYDVSAIGDGAGQVASARFGQHMVFYPGDEAQMPDPTIEAAAGAGNVEAYRGICYVVFTDLPVADYGNRVPSFTFELADAAAASPVEYLVPLQIFPWEDAGEYVKHSRGGTTRYEVYSFNFGSGGPQTISSTIYDDFPAARAQLSLVMDGYNVFVGYYTRSQFQLSAFNQGTDIADYNGPRSVVICFHKLAPYAVIWNGNYTRVALAGEYEAYGQNPNIPTSILASKLQRLRPIEDGLPDGHEQFGYVSMELYGAGPSLARGETYAYNATTFYGPDYPAPHFPVVWMAPFAIIVTTRIPSVPTKRCYPGDPVALGLAEMPGDAGFCISATGDISENLAYVQEYGVFKVLQPAETPSLTSGYVAKTGRGPVLRDTDPNYNNQAFWESAAAAAGVGGIYGADFAVVVSSAGVAMSTLLQAQQLTVPLSVIVSDVCARVGLAPGQIDVSALTGVTVNGYVRGRVMTARQAIEPLRAAYQFDAVESGDVIKFVRRGGAVAMTLDADNLGAGVEAAVEAVEHERRQESELPTAITLAYQALSADYQTGAQSSRRNGPASAQFALTELPIVLKDIDAARAADILLYDAWISRTRRKFSAPLSLSRLEPTDIVIINDGARNYQVRIADKSEADGIAKFEALDEDAGSFTTNPAAATTYGGGAAIRFDGPTALAPLDLPMLALADDATKHGYYLAASGYGARWRGCRVFRSVDGGVTYATITSITAPAIVGFTTNTLGEFLGGNAVDELSSVRVTIHRGELSSITRAQLLAGGNLCAVGDEVLQFQRATLVDAKTYTLTGFLRGRFGTEQHIGVHRASDRFVLLDAASIYRADGAVADIGRAAILKGVTFGLTIDGAYPVAFTNSGAAAKPLSVVRLAAGAAGGGSYAVKWVRRSRYEAGWFDRVDAPLGESTESYLVYVVRAGLVVSTQYATGTSATVEAIAADVVHVRQVSASVGLGFDANITIV